MIDQSLKQGYFFDLDGTLVNTHESNGHAYKQAVANILGITDIPVSTFIDLVKTGKNYKDFIPKAVPGIDAENLERIGKEKARIYGDFVHLSTLNEDLIVAARIWKSKGAKIVLVTTARKANAHKVLQHHGIEDIFDLMVFGDNIKNLKPAPDIYNHALELAEVDPKDALAFEDSPSGITSAKAAGLRVQIVDWCQ